MYISQASRRGVNPSLSYSWTICCNTLRADWKEACFLRDGILGGGGVRFTSSTSIRSSMPFSFTSFLDAWNSILMCECLSYTCVQYLFLEQTERCSCIIFKISKEINDRVMRTQSWTINN